jgi:hypothetical protein
MTARNRFARVLVRLYPRQWRDRYETEMLALVEQSGLTWRASLDLVFGAARAWVENPPRTFPARLVFLAVVMVPFNVIGTGVGRALQLLWHAPHESEFRVANAVLRLVVWLGLFAVARWEAVTDSRPPHMSLRPLAGAGLIAAAFVGLALHAWSAPASWSWQENRWDVLLDGAGLLTFVVLDAIALGKDRANDRRAGARSTAP